MKIKTYILFTFICISCFALGVITTYEIFAKEPYLDSIPGPQTWVNHSKISGLYDLHDNGYTLYIKDVPQIHIVKGVGSNSMSPCTNGVSFYLYIEPSSDDIHNIQIGDIILYNSSLTDIPVPHRVVEKYVSDGCFLFRAKGDNNQIVDNDVITPDMIVGVVIGVIY